MLIHKSTIKPKVYFTVYVYARYSVRDVNYVIRAVRAPLDFCNHAQFVRSGRSTRFAIISFSTQWQHSPGRCFTVENETKEMDNDNKTATTDAHIDNRLWTRRVWDSSALV